MLIAKDITKSYPTPRGELSILSGISLTLTRGDAIAIMGPSGSGKSTLLYILGALESPTAGVITLDGQNPFDFGEREQAAFRNRHIGFVFQDHSLLPQCSVLENVLTPTLAAAKGDGNPADDERRAREILDQVGLKNRMDHRPRSSCTPQDDPGRCHAQRGACGSISRPVRDGRRTIKGSGLRAQGSGVGAQGSRLRAQD